MFIIERLPVKGKTNAQLTFDGRLMTEPIDIERTALFLCDDYRQIGEISPFATWVKEGDVISLSDLAFGAYDGKTKEYLKFSDVSDFEPGISMCKEKMWCVKIKGCCGQFH